MNGSAAAVKEHDVGNVFCFHRLPTSQNMRYIRRSQFHKSFPEKRTFDKIKTTHQTKNNTKYQNQT